MNTEHTRRKKKSAKIWIGSAEFAASAKEVKLSLASKLPPPPFLLPPAQERIFKGKDKDCL